MTHKAPNLQTQNSNLEHISGRQVLSLLHPFPNVLEIPSCLFTPGFQTPFLARHQAVMWLKKNYKPTSNQSYCLDYCAWHLQTGKQVVIPDFHKELGWISNDNQLIMLRLVVRLTLMLLGWKETKLWTSKHGRKLRSKSLCLPIFQSITKII